MYRHFYQFTQKPFDVTPDPKFLYLSRNHQETLASITYGIRERKGFIAVIGEVGTGKTTLLNAALEKLDEKTKSAFIFNTDVTFEELLMTILLDLGIARADEQLPKYLALDRLNQYATRQFAAGENIVVFIDEAQNLSHRTMENLRLLSNLETSQYKLLQIVLSGQPELDIKLRQNELRQLAQRINLRRYIMPLGKRDTIMYVRHYLSVAEYPGKKLFTNAAMKKIWKYSKGVPRKINILCDNALLIGYGLGKKRISKAIVKEAIKDLSWSPYRHKKAALRKKEVNQTRSRRFFSRVAYASIVLLLGFFLGAGTFHQWQYFPGVMAEKPNRARHILTRLPETSPPSSPPAVIEDKSPETPRKPKETASINDFPLSAESSERPKTTNEPAPIAVLENKDRQDQREIENSIKEPDRISVIETPVDRELPFSSFSAKQLIPESSLPTTDSRPKRVVVQYGDTLSWIVQETYGEYQNMLPKVIQANPQLQNPDFIVPGQIIMLPRKSIKNGLPINPAS